MSGPGRGASCLLCLCTLPLSTLLQCHSVVTVMFIANLACGEGGKLGLYCDGYSKFVGGDPPNYGPAASSFFLPCNSFRPAGLLT